MGKLLNILVIFLTVVIGCLQFLPGPVDNESIIISWLRNKELNIVLCFGLTIILFHIYDLIRTKENARKKWLEELLHYIIDTHLGGKNYHTRASILTTKRGWQIIIPYIWHTFFCNFIENCRGRTWCIKLHNIPSRLTDEYLIVYARASYPTEQRKSLTNILVLRKKDSYNGIAEKCFRDGTEYTVNTVSIDNLHLESKLEKNTEEVKAKVRKYMKCSYMEEYMYNTLLNMNIIANNLYAIPILKADRSVWGILIFDNNEPTKKNFKEELKDAGAHYADIISLTVNTFKS